jgi:hypothetical protein
VKPSPARTIAWKVAAWLGVAVCAVTLYEQASSVPEPMKPDELARAARKVKSDAVEASALARALAAGQLTDHFGRKQHEEISSDLDDVLKQLDEPPPAGHEADAQRVRDALQRLDAIVQGIGPHVADSQAMSRIAEDEAALARSVDTGGGS